MIGKKLIHCIRNKDKLKLRKISDHFYRKNLCLFCRKYRNSEMWKWNCLKMLVILLVVLHPNRLDSGLVRSGLLVASSPISTSPESLKEALWMIWARWRPRCSLAFSRLRDVFLCRAPLAFPLPAGSSAASADRWSRRRGFRLPCSTLASFQPRPPPLLPLPFSASDSAVGEVTTPSCCRSAASGGGKYWMARLPL